MSTNVVIGSLYLDECKVEKYIPIFVLVAGAVGIVKETLKGILKVRDRWYKNKVPGDGIEGNFNQIDMVLNFFLFAWIIAGSYWVNGNYKPEFKNTDAEDYCNEICFMYAFWLLIIFYFMITCQVYSNTNILMDLRTGILIQLIEGSRGFTDCLENLSTLASCDLGCRTAYIILLLNCSIHNLVIGFLYLGDCKVEEYIPVFLLAAGAFGIVKAILMFLLQIGYTRVYTNKGDKISFDLKVIDELLSCIFFPWLIAGSVWVFSSYKPEFNDKDAKDYCHQTCYMYAYDVLITTYIILGSPFGCCICVVLLAVCFYILTAILQLVSFCTEVLEMIE